MAGKSDVSGNRQQRLVFASPLNIYSPPVRFTYDPARQPAKSLLARHSLPPAGLAARGPRNSDSDKNALSSFPSFSPCTCVYNRFAASNVASQCDFDDGSELANSKSEVIMRSEEAIIATANLLNTWRPPDNDAASMQTPNAGGLGTRGWAALLHEFSTGGLISFAQFQRALAAGDEREVHGLQEVREDADDLWSALVGDCGTVGSVSEMGELLTIACSERAPVRASVDAINRGLPLQRMKEEGDEDDMCNIETDSLDGDTEAPAQEHNDLCESMQKLRKFIGSQPRASSEGIASLEAFLAKDSAARDLQVIKPLRRLRSSLHQILALCMQMRV